MMDGPPKANEAVCSTGVASPTMSVAVWSRPGWPAGPWRRSATRFTEGIPFEDLSCRDGTWQSVAEAARINVAEHEMLKKEPRTKSTNARAFRDA